MLVTGSVMAQPSPNFSASTVNGCPPMVVLFTDLSTGSPTSWKWYFGNGDSSTSQNPTASYLTSGTYSVTLIATNASGSRSTTKTGYITVKVPPVVSFTGTPTAVCKGVPVSFSSSVTWNSTGGTNIYNWDFGDGGTSALANPTHAYTASGLYTVKLTAINGVGCPTTDTISNMITVHPGPIVNFSAASTSVCALGGTATFTSTSSGAGPLLYSWSFGDGGTSSSGGPVTHAYNSVGAYTVRLSVTDANGCTDSLKKTNYITVNSVTAAATVPASACAFSSVAVSSASGTTSGATISWDFGDGSALVTGSPASHSYTSANTYTVRMFATIGGCTDTASHTIVINPRPSVSWSYSPTNPCPTPVVITFTNNTTGAVGYNWDFDDGFTSSAASPMHTFVTDTTFNVKLTAFSAFGCSSSLSIPVTMISGDIEMFPMPTGFPFVIGGCVPVTINFSDTLYQNTAPGIHKPYEPVYPYPVVSRTWNFGDGSPTSGAAKPTHTYTSVGTYTSTITATTSNGCIFTDTLKIHVGNHGVPNFYVLPSRIVCAGQIVQFFDSSYSLYGPITNWDWDFGDFNYANAPYPQNIYKKPGTYTVTLVTSQNGCLDTIKKVNYMTVNPPASIPMYKVSCDTIGMVHFVDSSIGATSRLWYFGDGTSSTATNPDHQYAAAGATYKGSLVVWNNTTGCKDSTNFAVVINNLNIGIVADDSAVCPGDTIELSPVITGGGSGPSAIIKSLDWYTSSATGPWSKPPAYFRNGNNTFWKAPGRGRYNVWLSITDLNNCVSNKIINNFITVGGPIAHFKATPPHGCAPAIIVFTDTTSYAPGTSPASIQWDFGDGTKATVLTPTVNHAYANQGSYGISIKVTDNIGCFDSLGMPNYLNVTRPTALFTTLGTTACEGAAFTFYSSSTGIGISHLWNFGDGTTSTASNPNKIYNTSGTYTPRLIVTDQFGCKDTMIGSASINVYARPLAAFTMDDTINICPPLIVNFTNTSNSAVSYLWNFGNSSSSVLTNPTATYSNPGIYTIRLIAINSAGCRDTAYDRVRVLGYAGVLSYSPLKGCAPFTVYFKANNVPGVPGFIYNFGDGTTAASTASTFTHTYTTPGPHVPSIILTDNLGCSATSKGVDTIKVDGVYAGFTFNPFPACDRGTIQFIDTSKGAYSTLNPPAWTFHDGTGSSLPSPSKTYPGPGTYAVTLYSSTVSGCVDTFKSKVIFHPLPHIEAGKDTLICLTDSIVMKPIGGVSYAWSPAGSLSCAVCNNPYAFPSVPTRYVVIGTDSNGCTNKDSLMITLRYKTITTVTPNTEICSGDTLQLLAEGASVYHWSPAEGLSDANISNPAAYPMTDKHYMLISKLAGCIPDTDYVDIIVHPTPTVEAGIGKTIIAGDMIHLNAEATGIITKWLWSPSEGLLSPTSGTTDGYPKRSTLYQILVSTEYNCIATDTVRIIVMCDNSQVYLPNTFTPDGNGVNDVFYPRGKGLANIDRFRIYNRWGEVVFERLNVAVEDKRVGWDGKMNGRLLTPDIYVYTVEATCDTGEPIKWQGDVMLLR
jgi:gliding motility-associated-like protein